MVVVMVAFLFSRVKRMEGDVELMMYGPKMIVDECRQKNLQLIYNSSCVECLSMLRMTSAPFFLLYDLFRQRGFVLDTINSSAD